MIRSIRIEKRERSDNKVGLIDLSDDETKFDVYRLSDVEAIGSMYQV